jgi:D-aminopeptidase
VGLGRVGGNGHNSSGDLFLAFATGNHLPLSAAEPIAVQMLPNDQLDPFFVAVADAVEESILNALCAAETLTGQQGRVAHALPLDELHTIMQRFPFSAA